MKNLSTCGTFTPRMYWLFEVRVAMRRWSKCEWSNALVGGVVKRMRAPNEDQLHFTTNNNHKNVGSSNFYFIRNKIATKLRSTNTCLPILPVLHSNQTKNNRMQQVVINAKITNMTLQWVITFSCELLVTCHNNQATINHMGNWFLLDP